jgi:hypothetical protein
MSFEECSDCFLWKCDHCPHTTEFAPHDFRDCVDELKSRGWGFQRDDEGGWTHWCPRCRKAGMERISSLFRKSG